MPYLYPEFEHSLDPVFDVELSKPDMDKYPLLQLTTPVECFLQPGNNTNILCYNSQGEVTIIAWNDPTPTYINFCTKEWNNEILPSSLQCLVSQLILWHVKWRFFLPLLDLNGFSLFWNSKAGWCNLCHQSRKKPTFFFSSNDHFFSLHNQ